MSAGLDWAVWFLVGALGGLVTIVFAVAIRSAYRRGSGASPEPLERAVPSPSAIETSVPSSGLPPGSSLIGYVATPRVPAGDDDSSEAAGAIEDACARAAWKLVEIVQDRDDGPCLGRPGLRFALERISAGGAQGLIVRDLDRFSRSIVDLGTLLAWFRDADAALIALDPALDTSTPEGRHVATTLIALSARDHERIAAGTRRGLAQGRADGRRNGRPAVSHRPELVERIAAMRAANMTLHAIAEQLNAEGVPTLRGGKKWRPSSIQAALGYQRPTPRDHLPAPERGAPAERRRGQPR
jgi:DNA invertase Pin-like site-specific DNA recombinase